MDIANDAKRIFMEQFPSIAEKVNGLDYYINIHTE